MAVIKFLFLRSCLSPLFTSNDDSLSVLLVTFLLKSRDISVTINHALIPCPVASPIKKLYFSFAS